MLYIFTYVHRHGDREKRWAPGHEIFVAPYLHTMPCSHEDIKICWQVNKSSLKRQTFQVGQKKITQKAVKVALFWEKGGWPLKRTQKATDFVFTRHSQGFRFHLAPFRNRFQIAPVRMTFSHNFDPDRVNAKAFCDFLAPFSTRSADSSERGLFSHLSDVCMKSQIMYTVHRDSHLIRQILIELCWNQTKRIDYLHDPCLLDN